MALPADAHAARWWVDRSGRLTAAVVLGAAAIAWALMLARPAMPMPGMGGGGPALGMSAMSAPVWTWADATAFLAAWALMMTAMMLPSATPMIALFSLVNRSRAPHHRSTRIAAFTLPYVALWALTGIPVYTASVLLSQLTTQHPSVHRAGPYAVGSVLLAAGGYQFSRLKKRCLTSCTTPLGFLLHHWQPGAIGAARMGAQHAIYCLGCCAMLMAVLVVGGSMGLAWVLLIAAAILIEKIASSRIPAAALTGIALLTLGGAILIDPGLASQLHS